LHPVSIQFAAGNSEVAGKMHSIRATAAFNVLRASKFFLFYPMVHVAGKYVCKGMRSISVPLFASIRKDLMTVEYAITGYMYEKKEVSICQDKIKVI
jgi:hypothetical protein